MLRSTEVPRALDSGRLLVYFPNDELADGAAQDSSAGFFDTHNCPPWDTWVAMIEERRELRRYPSPYLLAWVPRELVEHTTWGIDQNPEGCIVWLEDSNLAISEVLAGISTV